MSVVEPTEQVKVGSQFTVIGVSSPDATLANKLRSLGLVAGTQLKVTQVAPFGGPLEICFCGYNISLRRAEFDALLIHK